MIGGALMVVVGILYLIFEDFILAEFSSSKKSSNMEPKDISRVIVGIQIGLVLLSMWVTRSSALSLQAKLGLPRGNQVVGWAVLSKYT